MATDEPVQIAILAKAPVPGFAKTRLIASLGAERAARLQMQLIERAARTAASAKLDAVTLWGAPDVGHPVFQRLGAKQGFAIRPQVQGDLGVRMLAAVEAANGPVLVIGTDCPGLSPTLLRTAAHVLEVGGDAVLFPAEDGGYGLIGMRRAHPTVFDEIPWGSDCVMGETRRRLTQLGLKWEEPALLWDVDTPADLDRLCGTGVEP
jgi:rSAM/selenodomain-associated transferase 1